MATLAASHVCPPGRVPLPYVALFVNKDNSMVIVEQKDDEVCFPRLECPEVPHFTKQMCDCFTQRFGAMCGTTYELIFLYSSNNYYYEMDLRPIHAIFQCISPIDDQTGEPIQPASDKYKWKSISEMGDLVDDTSQQDKWHRTEYAAHASLIRADLYECVKGGYRAWELPNWHMNVTKEATDTLARLGYITTGAFEQFQVTQEAAVLRVGTNKGTVYLKAGNRTEGSITALIASFAPQLARKPLFVNEENEWMLSRDYGRSLGEDLDGIDFERFFARYGDLQLESIRHVEALKRIGVPAVCCESLIGRTKTMLEDERVLSILGGLQEFEGSTTDGFADVKVHREALCELLRELYQSGKCPLSLVRGDIRGNVIEADYRWYVVLGWGQATIDVALKDLMPFLDHMPCSVSEQYLNVWEKYASPSELQSFFPIVAIKARLEWALRDYHYALQAGRIPILCAMEANMLKSALVEAKGEFEQRSAAQN